MEGLHEAQIRRDEVNKKIREMKTGKAAGLDWSIAVCQKFGEMSIIEW